MAATANDVSKKNFVPLVLVFISTLNVVLTIWFKSFHLFIGILIWGYLDEGSAIFKEIPFLSSLPYSELSYTVFSNTVGALLPLLTYLALLLVGNFYFYKKGKKLGIWYSTAIAAVSITTSSAFLVLFTDQMHLFAYVPGAEWAWSFGHPAINQIVTFIIGALISTSIIHLIFIRFFKKHFSSKKQTKISQRPLKQI